MAKRKTIEFSELQKLSSINGKKLHRFSGKGRPPAVSIAGVRHEYVGIGWVEIGPEQGDEPMVVEDGKVPVLYVYAAGSKEPGTLSGIERGKLSGAERVCKMESCPGKKLSVVWPDGKKTWPCTGGMRIRKDGQYQIR